MNHEYGIMISCALIMAGSLALGYVVGFASGDKTGEARGIAKGWQDGYFQRLADDRSRRAKNGQFIATRGRGMKQ